MGLRKVYTGRRIEQVPPPASGTRSATLQPGGHHPVMLSDPDADLGVPGQQPAAPGTGRLLSQGAAHCPGYSFLFPILPIPVRAGRDRTHGRGCLPVITSHTWVMIITITNIKGGVGKTTLAANLGGYLADLGKRVLAVDADIQPTLSSYYPIEGLAPNGLSHLITEADVTDVISRTTIPNLSRFTAPASPRTRRCGWSCRTLPRPPHARARGSCRRSSRSPPCLR